MPTNLVAAAADAVVTIGWRSVGCCSLDVSTAFSADGRQWRVVDTPWAPQTSAAGLLVSYGAPAALAFGDGTFLAVGQRFEIAADLKPIGNAFATRSSDAITWLPIDLRASLGALYPKDLVRFGGRWIMTADPWADGVARDTQVFSSVDGMAWEHIATVGFEVVELRQTSFGLVAIGVSGDSNSRLWLSAVSTDAHVWNATKLDVAPRSGVTAVLADTDQIILAVNDVVTANTAARKTRLLSSTDGVRWRTIAAPPCVTETDHSGPAAAAHGTWAILVDSDSPQLALSIDHGATWSCTNLTGDTFDIDRRWGPPEFTDATVLQDTIVLTGGRTLEPGAKANRSAAIWYIL